MAQNDATVHGAGSHDKTGRHCLTTDPHGKLVQGHYVDALQVSVYALSKAVQPADLVTHSGDFKAIVDGLTKGLPMFAVSDPFRPITVNGTKGFQITYTYGIHSTPAGAMSYLLLKGRYAYWITGQATADTWSAVTLLPNMPIARKARPAQSTPR